MKSIHEYRNISGGAIECKLEIDPNEKYSFINLSASGVTVVLTPQQARWAAQLILLEVLKE